MPHFLNERFKRRTVLRFDNSTSSFLSGTVPVLILKFIKKAEGEGEVLKGLRAVNFFFFLTCVNSHVLCHFFLSSMISKE